MLVWLPSETWDKNSTASSLFGKQCNSTWIGVFVGHIESLLLIWSIRLQSERIFSFIPLIHFHFFVLPLNASEKINILLRHNHSTHITSSHWILPFPFSIIVSLFHVAKWLWNQHGGGWVSFHKWTFSSPFPFARFCVWFSPSIQFCYPSQHCYEHLLSYLLRVIADTGM